MTHKTPPSAARRTVKLFAATITCLSLTSCSGSLFAGTVRWEGDGAIYVNDRKMPQEESTPRMQLTLNPDGTGYAFNIPQGRPKFDGNVCIEVSDVELYSGELTWRNENKASFEISFVDSSYTILSGPEKWNIDWNEIQLYNCDPGPQYWRMDSTVDLELIPRF